MVFGVLVSSDWEDIVMYSFMGFYEMLMQGALNVNAVYERYECETFTRFMALGGGQSCPDGEVAVRYIMVDVCEKNQEFGV